MRVNDHFVDEKDECIPTYNKHKREWELFVIVSDDQIDVCLCQQAHRCPVTLYQHPSLVLLYLRSELPHRRAIVIVRCLRQYVDERNR